MTEYIVSYDQMNAAPAVKKKAMPKPWDQNEYCLGEFPSETQAKGQAEHWAYANSATNSYLMRRVVLENIACLELVGRVQRLKSSFPEE